MNTNINIIFMVDGTASMSSFLNALKRSIKEILLTTGLLKGINVGVLVYRDYDCEHSTKTIQWSGWNHDLLQFVHDQQPFGGGDYEEAQKTALKKIHELLMEDKCKTLVIHYTDSCPHIFDDDTLNYKLEKRKLHQFDWYSICAQFKSLPITFLNILPPIKERSKQMLMVLGDVVNIDAQNAKSVQTITYTTMSILNTYLGLEETNFTIHYIEEHQYIVFEPKLLPDHVFKWRHGTFNPIATNIPKLDDAMKDFKEDEAFRTKVYHLFQDSIHIDIIEALSYNTVLGSLWRQICTRIRSDVEAQQLAMKMSQVISELEPEKKKEIQDWLEKSYDNSEYINECIHKIESQKVFVLPKQTFLDKREMMNIVTCKSRMSDASNLMKTLAHLSIVPKNKTMAHFIPVELPNDKLFSMLGHLIAPGLVLSRVPAFILAMYCVISENKYLKPRAVEYLEANKGSWLVFDEDNPQNFSATMVRCLNQIKFLLTDDEIETLTQFNHIMTCRQNLNRQLTLNVPYKPYERKQLMPDHTVECTVCNLKRSFTLMHSKTVCGPCSIGMELGIDTCNMDSLSYLYECRTCAALYAVIQTEKLNVTPKCHFCRAASLVPSIQCKTCLNRFVNEAGFFDDDSFECKQCQVKVIDSKEIHLTLSSILQSYPEILEHIGIHRKSGPLLTNPQGSSIFKIYREIVHIEPHETIPDLTFKHKPVYEPQKVVLELVEQLQKLDPKEMCILCCDEYPLHEFIDACGHCSNRMCKTCFKSWYEVNQVGCIVSASNFNCPFCKQIPKYSVIRPINHLIAMVTRNLTMEPNQYYAWCSKCNQIKYFCDQECARDVPDVKNYICDPCRRPPPPPERIVYRVYCDQDEYDSDDGYDSYDEYQEYQEESYPYVGEKECPTCGVMIEKAGGCNHISCVCRSHWCWHCQFASNSGDIVYNHLSRVHGGFFNHY
jgi:hypothetical protein